jgi:phosphoenolpyruvate phosphomutase
MQQTAAQIYSEQTLVNIEPEVVSVKEIFRLQNAEELKEAEMRYLPEQDDPGMRREVMTSSLN